MKYRPYDISKRKEAYDFFSRISNPFYMVTFRQDVTRLYDFAKARNISFYYALVWAVTKAVNRSEVLRLGLLDDEIVLYDERKPSFTDLKPGSEQFYIVTMDPDDDILVFCQKARDLSSRQETFIDENGETADLIYITCLPWIDITALTNERDLADPAVRNDNIPRIAWGRYVSEGEKKILGLSLEVNHRFVDGLHIGQFARDLSSIIDELPL